MTKKICKFHMLLWCDTQVTPGEEGFFGLDSGHADADPSGIPQNVLAAGRYWSAKIGQDFAEQHNFTDIDYGTIHLWPDNWETEVFLSNNLS